MTLEEAVAELRGAGLEVSVGPDGFSVATDPSEPPPVVAQQGVVAVYAFGFSAHQHGSIWFFRHRGTGRGPAEQFERLEEVVGRGLMLVEEYRRNGT